MVGLAPVIRIQQQIDFHEVNWKAVREILVVRFRFSEAEAGKEIKLFVRHFLTPFNLFWFIHPELKGPSDRICAAICAAHGSDSVILTRNRKLLPLLSGLGLEYDQRVIFSPGFRGRTGESAGRCEPRIDLGIYGRKITLTSTWQVIALQIAAAGAAIAGYVLIMFALLYSFSVLFMFIKAPGAVTAVATQKLHVWLALLCLLCGIAALSGRLISKAITPLAKKFSRGVSISVVVGGSKRKAVSKPLGKKAH
jgi:hypothetical protein